ncbi:MAG: pilus assembly protein PilM [Planctomycetes bacterium]|nr:pilus assembly protein PilM [Planctomycetota bacterium]MCK5472642.1 pilus assembly protein PilM [Planctomycetota bacterium]
MIAWKLKTRNHSPIGLDIGHDSIKMIQLTASGGRIGVLAADKVKIDSGLGNDAEQRRDFVVSAVEQMLSKGGFRGKSVVSCLANDELKITSLRLPQTDDGETQLALEKEVSQRFGLDPDKDTVKYMLAGDVKQADEVKNELILFATDSDTIKNHIDLLEQVQLRPVAIDTIPCALFRSFNRSLRRQEDMENTVVFMDVGSHFTTVVFGRGEQICFIKQIPIGGEKFNLEIASKLGVTVEEAEILRRKLRKERAVNSTSGSGELQSEQANFDDGQWLDASMRQVVVDALTSVSEELAKEISLCFRYYTVTFRGKRVERAVFAGGQAYENILLNVLKRQLTVDIELAQPLRGFDMSQQASIHFDSDRRGLLCEWAVAVGLSLKGWQN